MIVRECCINLLVCFEVYSTNLLQIYISIQNRLKQIPGFSSEIIQRCTAANVTQVTDIMESVIKSSNLGETPQKKRN
jgi:hypothetical protein